MPRFSESSRQRLLTCDGRLIHICSEIIPVYDFKVLYGHRGEDIQNRLFDQGLSKLRYPQSKHNSYPSLAVDLAPWPVDWQDEDRFCVLAGMVLYVGRKLGVNIRWGGDWDQDDVVADTRWRDLGHFEIVDP